MTVKNPSAPGERTRAQGAQPLQRHATARGVVTYSPGARGAPDGHMASRRKETARRLAAFMGFACEGEYDPLVSYATAPYFVPGDTLTRDTATRLGIRGEHDLFGGVVPFVF